MSAHAAPVPPDTNSTLRPPGHRPRAHSAADVRLLESVRESVMSGTGPVTPSRVAAAVHATGRLLGTAGALAAVESISAELNGLGPLQALVRDPAVTDIFVNGPEAVWLDRGNGLEKAPVVFSGEPQIRALAARLVAAGGRRLDDGSPCVDVRLDGGYRVHAVLPPISTAGTLLSVRIRREKVFTMGELRQLGMFGTLVQDVLERSIERRLSFLISGATGSGKTTLLATLLGLCHPAERLVLIEDASELNPVHPHVVSLESRHGNLEGNGVVDLGELVRQALRMRPDRLVVGECRGAEVRELLSAMNTGHTGGGGTIHANTAAAVPARLTALGALAGMGQDAVRLQTASALDAVVHVARAGNNRYVACIGVLEDTGSGLAVSVALDVGGGGTGVRYGPAWPRLADRLGLDPGVEDVPV
ncbi:TadA family conjugal transfer-associated ATPase [Arthrobacter sp. UYCu712]|uniref:TadA family conjugal transfer-associated ATPase n=1 Tax=Arthrobacter sp. UYCu712 TaxID=3156340 RepID=UPI003395CEB5